MKVLRIFVAALLLVFTGVATAETVSYKSEGTITSIDSADIGCSFKIGGRFTSCITIQTDANDYTPEPNIGNYYHEYAKYVVGTCTFEALTGYVFIHNDDPNDEIGFSNYLLNVEDEDSFTGGGDTTVLFPNFVLTSDNLPLSDTNFDLTEEHSLQ